MLVTVVAINWSHHKKIARLHFDRPFPTHEIVPSVSHPSRLSYSYLQDNKIEN